MVLLCADFFVSSFPIKLLINGSILRSTDLVYLVLVGLGDDCGWR